MSNLILTCYRIMVGKYQFFLLFHKLCFVKAEILFVQEKHCSSYPHYSQIWASEFEAALLTLTVRWSVLCRSACFVLRAKASVKSHGATWGGTARNTLALSWSPHMHCDMHAAPCVYNLPYMHKSTHYTQTDISLKWQRKFQTYRNWSNLFLVLLTYKYKLCFSQNKVVMEMWIYIKK